MRYLIYTTRTGATNRSRAEAMRRNCGPVTLYWWSVAEGASGDHAVEVPDEDEPVLTATDRSRMTTTFDRKVEDVR